MHTISAGHFQCVSGHSSLLGQNITRKEHAFQLNCGTNVLKITVILTFLSWMDVDNGHGKVKDNNDFPNNQPIKLITYNYFHQLLHSTNLPRNQ